MCLVKDTTRHDTTWHKKTQKNFWKKKIFFQKFIFLIIPFLKIIEHIMRFLYIPLMPNLNFQKIFFKVFKKIIYTIFVSFRVVSCRVVSYGVMSCPFVSCRVLSIGQSNDSIMSKQFFKYFLLTFMNWVRNIVE